MTTDAQKELNFDTVEDNLPMSSLWQHMRKEMSVAAKIGLIIVCVFFAIVLFFTIAVISYTPAADLAGAWVMLASMTAIIVATISIFVFALAKSTRVKLRAMAFVQANGFYFVKELNNPGHSGLIFSVGDTRKASTLIIGNYKKHEFKVFNYSYVTGSGKNRSEHKKGVIMLKLPRKVPHVVFDSKANNLWGLSSLEMAFAKSQRFTFEGDFNKHFDVYAPQHYGRDVLYFMTPELMALLIDKAGKYDIEAVDDDLFFYGPEFDYKQNALKNIFNIIETVGGEFSENTQRYADERVGDKNLNLVSEEGRRLKQKVSWAVWAIVVIYLFFMMLRIISGTNT